VKVAILGATSQSTPALFRALRDSPSVAQLSFALAARSRERLAAIERAIGIIGNDAFSVTSHDFCAAELAACMSGSAVVVIQIRYGGLQGREFDERFSLPLGICGDEGLGPGGFSAAWRAWPPLERLLGCVARESPGAEVILLTSPCSLLTRLARLRWPELSVRALCELPMTTLLAAGGTTERYDYLGINHLGWLYGLPQRDPIPLKYWRLQDDAQAMLAEQSARRESRAAELQRLSEAALERYASANAAQIEACLDARPSPWYSHALAPYLESFVERRSALHFFFSDVNAGWHGTFHADDVLEFPHCWERGTLVRKPVRVHAPRNLLGALAPFVEYERLAAQVILSRGREAVSEVLSHHPWVSSRGQAAALAHSMLAAEQAVQDGAIDRVVSSGLH
jgi:6-phospho-beta-glucosidase